jgi:phosphatidylserine/phosphatidylglycerophosphate/cardiolipin synthase-like enzyme
MKKIRGQQHLLWSVLIIVLFLTCSKRPSDDDGSDPNNRLLEIYTNYPGIRPGGQKPPEFDIRLAQMIDGAKRQVYWAMYGFSRPSIQAAVLRAVQRGLDEQLAGDEGTYASGEVGYGAFSDLLRRYPNAKLITGNSASIQHNKFCVIDGRFLMTGTGNISNSEIDQNYNIWTLIESREMAADYIDEHQQMMAGRFGHAKDRVNYNNVFDVGGVKIEVYFSPYEDPMARFLQGVQEAQSSVHFAIFAFTHDQLGRLFIQKHKEFTAAGNPKAVHGVMDRSQIVHDQYVEVYRIGTSCGHTYGFEAGTGVTNGGNTNPFTASWDTTLTQANTRCYAPFDLKIDGNENTTSIGDWQAGGGRLHAKTIAIDAGTPNAKLMMGSFNWSPNADLNNDENLIVIHSPAIVDRYIKFWEGIYNDGIPLNKRYPTNQELQQGIITYQQRDIGDYQKVVISEVNYAGSARKIGGLYYAYDGNEFIELYNPSNSPVDVSFWGLYFPVIDNYTDPGVYGSGFPSFESLQKQGMVGFPGGTIVPAKGFLIVTQSDQPDDPTSDGYLFSPSVLYDPANTATWGNKITYYNPVNGLSNFFTLFDRRSSGTGRRQFSTQTPLTFDFPAFFDTQNQTQGSEICRAAWISTVDRFSGSSYFNPYHLHSNPVNPQSMSSYPHLTSLWVELRDNRGNLVDIVGGNRTGGAIDGLGKGIRPTIGADGTAAGHAEVRYFKGGFHKANLVGDTSDVTRGGVISPIDAPSPSSNLVTGGGVASYPNAPNMYTTFWPLSVRVGSSDLIGAGTWPVGNAGTDKICGMTLANTPYMVSMERKTTFGPGTTATSWDHATKDLAAGGSGGNGGSGTYIRTEYKDRTIATPGEINSRWSALP